jgi:chemotaxis protein CheD
VSTRAALLQTFLDTSVAQRAPTVELPPGQLIVAAAPCTVTTVLGSGVSVGLWDRVRHVGGMNHFLLPEGDESARCGAFAMQALVTAVLSLGALAKNMDAHVLGGARVGVRPIENADLGERNVDFAIAWLESAGLELSALDVGGDVARRVSFCLRTGKIRSDRVGGRCS